MHSDECLGMVCCPPSEFVGEALGWMDGSSEGVSEFFFQILENLWTPAALPGAWKMIFNCRSCDSAGFEMTSNLLKLWKDRCFFSFGEGYVMLAM